MKHTRASIDHKNILLSSDSLTPVNRKVADRACRCLLTTAEELEVQECCSVKACENNPPTRTRYMFGFHAAVSGNRHLLNTACSSERSGLQIISDDFALKASLVFKRHTTIQPVMRWSLRLLVLLQKTNYRAFSFWILYSCELWSDQCPANAINSDLFRLFLWTTSSIPS